MKVQADLAGSLRLGRRRLRESRAAIGGAIDLARAALEPAEFRAWLLANFGCRRRPPGDDAKPNR